MMSDEVTGVEGLERRRHHRVSVSVPASLLLNDSVSVARCVSLSMGGARLHSRTPLPQGSVLKLKFGLGARRVHTVAEVVRSEGNDAGVRFTQLDPDSMGTILSSVS